MKKLIEEFKKFITRGNVLDLAVGVIVGGSFTKIVTSLVNDILTPLVGIIIGGLDFSELKITVGESNIMYGSFIQAVVDFFIVAICVFIIVKSINNFNDKIEAKVHKKAKEEVKVEPPKEDEQTKLLKEIRDLLKNK